MDEYPLAIDWAGGTETQLSKREIASRRLRDLAIRFENRFADTR